MSDDEGKKITEIEFPARKHPIKIVDRLPGSCEHRICAIDVSKDSLECEKCGEEINPYWYIRQLATRDSYLSSLWDSYRSIRKNLAEKKRFKCRHCNKFTNIR